MKWILLAATVVWAALFAACAAVPQTSSTVLPPPASAQAPPAEKEPSLPAAEEYAAALAREQLAEWLPPDMDDVEEVAAIYRYMVENIYFAEPPYPDLWRLRCRADAPPAYLYSRALWPLCHRIGSCEDFAAALAVLLREAGFQAEYVSGLTVSAKREWVDHAWTVVRLGDDWYHLDSQLEQNVLKGGILDYRYFLRDDEWMLADHLWGTWLAAYWNGRQTPEQRRMLLETMTPPLCQNASVSRPGPVAVTMNPPDPARVAAETEREREAYRRENGAPPAETNWEPPLFSVMPN